MSADRRYPLIRHSERRNAGDLVSHPEGRGVHAAFVLLAQQDAPDPILPETNDWMWSVTSIIAVLIPVVVVILLVRYLVATRRIAESAAAESRALREELRSKDRDPASSA